MSSLYVSCIKILTISLQDRCNEVVTDKELMLYIYVNIPFTYILTKIRKLLGGRAGYQIKSLDFEALTLSSYAMLPRKVDGIRE